MTAPDYQIRSARLDEIDRIEHIEDEAGTLFDGLGLIDAALDVVFPRAELVILIAAGTVWVAVDDRDEPIGTVIASVRDGAVHVEEMDVLPHHARHGLGSGLLSTVVDWASDRGFTAVTLSTFRDVAWNAPFYARRGFVTLSPSQWTPTMHTLHAEERSHGLAVDERVFMRRTLSTTDDRL